MRKILPLILFLSTCFAETVNTDILPASSGLRLGHSNQRWNAFIKNLDISGTCNINGVPCGAGGGGTSIATYTVASLPPSPPVNTLAIVTDASGPSCTIGGSSSSNLCRFNGFQWVLVSGGSGSSTDFSTLGSGTALSKSFFLGNGSSMAAVGTGTIFATNVPITKVAVLNQWLDAYDSVGRTFHASQPAYSSLSGSPTIDQIRTSTNAPWLLMDPLTTNHNDGLEFSFVNGSLSIFPFGITPTVQVNIAGKGGAQVAISNLIANGLNVSGIASACLEADATGAVHAASGGLCGSGGSFTFPLNAPDGSQINAQYSFTNHPELGLAVALDGDKPQIRQVVVSGSAGTQTITLTVSAPINNLSWNAGDRFILSSLPSSPTDLSSLNGNLYVVSSVTATSPTGTATFNSTTSIAAGTYPVTAGFAQIYGGFLVGRSFQFNRLESSTTNPAQSGGIRFARRDAVKARSNFSDDTTIDVAHIRGSAAIAPNNSPGTGIMTVNGSHSSGATTLSIAKGATAWSAIAGDQILIAASNGDSDNQKYSIVSNVTVAANTNTSVIITPALKTGLNGGELIVSRFIRTQVGEESGVELPGDTELKGDLTITSTKPTLIQVKKQSSTPTLNTSYDGGWYLDSTNHFACKLSVALGGGSCAPTGVGGYSVIQGAAVSLPPQTTVNFTGAGVSCADNPGSSRTDCTIPGGSGISGSGTASKLPKFTGAGAIGDSSIDDGLTAANTVTINATGGLSVLGSGVAAVVGLKPGTTPVVVAGNMGLAGPTTVTTAGLLQLPGAYSTGFLAAGTPTLDVYPGAFRSMAATSPITITNGNGAAGNPTYACPTCGVTGSPLSQFAATTSTQLANTLTDEIGGGKAVFASAYQGTDTNVMSSGTVAGLSAILCTDAVGGATTSACNAVTSSSPGVGVAHFAGSTQALTSSPVNLAGGATEISGLLPLASLTQQFTTNAQTGTYQVLAADFMACKTITVASGTFTITLVASGSQPPDGQCIDIVNYGSGVVTVARSGQNINGAAANLTLAAASASSPTSLHVVSSGANYFAEAMGVGTGGGVTTFTGDGTVITNSGSSGAVTLTVAGTSGGIPCFGSASSWKSSALLAASGLLLGQGATNCPSTVAGFTTDGTSKLTLGVAGTSVGSIDFKNATSGIMNIAPPTGALGTINIVGPAASGTMMMTNTNVSAGQMPALTGDVTTSAGAVATTIAALVVTGAKIANNTVTATQLAAQYSKLSCERGLGDGLNAMGSGTYLQSTCYNYTGATITITGIKCFTDNNGSSTLNVTNGAGTALLTGAVTCTNTYASGTQSGTVTIASADFVKLTFVADGASKQTDWVVLETY